MSDLAENTAVATGIPISIDRAIFEQAYNRHWKGLYLASIRYTGDEDLAKEIVQDIYKYVWEKRDEIVIRSTLENYLYGMMKMKVFEYHRSVAVREKYHEYRKQQNVDLNYHTENEVLFKELLGNVNVLIEQLPARCREIFKLSREEGLSNKAISSLLLISEKAVEKNMTKALASLRQGISFLL